MKTVKAKFYPSLTDTGLAARSIIACPGTPVLCACHSKSSQSGRPFSLLFLFLRCIFLVFGDNLIRLKVHDKESEVLKFNLINWAQ